MCGTISGSNFGNFELNNDEGLLQLVYIFYSLQFYNNIEFHRFANVQVVLEAIKTAEKISEHSPLIVSFVKDAVNCSYETFLQEGLRYESRLFHATFATVFVIHIWLYIYLTSHTPWFAIRRCKSIILFTAFVNCQLVMRFQIG